MSCCCETCGTMFEPADADWNAWSKKVHPGPLPWCSFACMDTYYRIAYLGRWVGGHITWRISR